VPSKVLSVAVPDFRLGDIAEQLGGELIGNPDLRITRIGPLESATPSTISFLSHPKYAVQLAASQAACVIVNLAMRDAAVARGAAILTADAYLFFARLTQWWAAQTRPPASSGIHPSAVVDATATLASGVSVGPLAVIEANVVIESDAVIGAHCHVGANAHVGAATRLAPRVTLGASCRIGQRGIVHSGVVIGADGFGFAPFEGRWEKIEQLGNVRIGNDVEIGANTCIDRGALDDTVIEDGVKLDNLVQIGHNVRIGAHSALAGCAGVAGSAVIGAHCTVGGGAIVLGHLTLADHVHISAASVVMRSISKPGTYSGVFPIDDNSSWEKNAATLRQLHGLRDRVRALERTQERTKT
jgi:UDP-3-O-[3-hydroxymyristoyl] glucosamine N-acyltransferase